MVTKNSSFIFLVVLLVLCPRPVAAHPPTDIQLSYDAPAAILHIEVVHLAKNLQKDGIRQLVVYKNDRELAGITIVRQTTHEGLTNDFPLKAAAGDTIRVRAISKKGGDLEQTIVIPEEEKEGTR